jgi:hypothetical protein
MAMTHVITVPKSSFLSPFYQFEGLGSQLYHFGTNAYHRVTYLDELMVLEFNKLKATYLLRSLNSGSIPLGNTAESIQPTGLMQSQEARHFVDDCCVFCDSDDQSIEVVYAPLLQMK